jgi:hypothetical protein
MYQDEFIMYTLRLTLGLKKFLEHQIKTSHAHTKLYLEFTPSNIELYLKNDITYCYTKILLKHLGPANT